MKAAEQELEADGSFGSRFLRFRASEQEARPSARSLTGALDALWMLAMVIGGG